MSKPIQDIEWSKCTPNVLDCTDGDCENYHKCLKASLALSDEDRKWWGPIKERKL